MKAIIVGGGIGGLAAAIALDRAGVEADVFERAPAFDEVGAGLTLWANAMKALQILGIATAVQRVGAQLREGTIRRWDGSVLSRVDLAQASRQAGATNVCLRRSDLQAALREGVDPSRLHLGHESIGFEQGHGRVSAHFANGAHAEADVLIGADGLHSAVRRELHGPERPRYAGYTAWRGVAEGRNVADGIPGSSESWGSGKRFGLIPVGRDGVYWFGTANAPEGAADGPEGRKHDVRNAFADWHHPIPDVIEATPEVEILRNDIYDRKPLQRWGTGLVTLLGDAAHPTTPNLGQGACQAIEDAVVLAHRLTNAATPEIGLRGYEAARRQRTASVTRTSRLLGQVGQWKRRAPCAIRDYSVRLSPTRLQLFLSSRLWDFEP